MPVFGRFDTLLDRDIRRFRDIRYFQKPYLWSRNGSYFLFITS